MRYLTYLNERSPIAALSILSLGTAFMPMAMKGSFDPLILIITLFVNNLIFIILRMCDEMKDYEKDKIINPTRPLPRGLFSISEFKKLIYLHYLLLVLSSLAIGLSFTAHAFISLSITILFSWLMYKEFYIGKKLEKSPILYALTHQVITIPLFAWPSLMSGESINHQFLYGWLIANFGASFIFEICRKLDPESPKLAGTYASFYGNKKTAFFCFILAIVNLYGAYLSDAIFYSAPFILLVILSIFSWLKNPSKFKSVAGASALLSLITLWYPAIMWALNIWNKK